MAAGRTYFWTIEAGGLFYLLAALALATAAWGAGLKLRAWLAAPEGPAWPKLGQGWRRLLRDGLLGRRLFHGDPAAGLMHLLIAWGFLGLFLGTVLVAVDHYLVKFLTGPTYLVFSALLEAGGLALLAGLVWALARRYLLRLNRLERRWDDLLAPLWLLGATLSGFLVEAARLAALRPPAWDWSLVGAALARLWAEPAAAEAAHPWLWWAHALVSLGLVAWLPWAKLGHSLAAPVSLLLQDQPAWPPQVEDPSRLGFRELVHLQACPRCGRCVEACPSAQAGEPLSPRSFLQAFRSGPQARPAGAWHCTTCAACVEVCPVAAAPLGLVRRHRAGLVEAGADVPLRLAETLEKLARYDNPWLARKGLKAGWAAGLNPPAGEPEALLFLGCTGAVEPRAQAAARALAQVLAAAGLPYATLGKNEPCCGDVARQAGEMGLWADQAERARDQIEAAGVERIVVGSPHCFDALAQAGLRARVVHYVQALAELVHQGRLRPDRPVDLTVAFHDPCFLARRHGLVAEPRRVLAALPGLRLRELAAHGRETLCCGGGGGRLWSEPEGQADLAGRRLAQAQASGVQALVTACPYCLIMLQAASKNLGSASPLLVLDLAELVALGLGLAEPPPREG